MKFFSFLFFASIFSCFSFTDGYAQLSVSNTMTPQQLVQNVLLGTGVTATNITYTGSPIARGTFNGAASNIGLGSGVLLTTGSIFNAPGPNDKDNSGTDNLRPGNHDLNTLADTSTQDACILEFDFVPLTDTVRFRYVFGSEEYNEYVCSFYNDVFAFFISGPGITGFQNIALIPGTATPVTINRLNNGSCGLDQPFHTGCDLSNSAYFIDNENPPGATVQYDGFTTVFTAQARVIPCQTYHIRLAIADAGDGMFDSGVFLEAGSFASGTAVIASAQPTSGIQVPAGIIGCAPFTATFLNTSTGTNQFLWNFGDGSPVETIINPAHVFTHGGTYRIQLIADDTSVCDFSDTSYFTLTVDSGNLSPSFNLTQNGNCNPILINATSTSTGAHLYSWNFGDHTVAGGASSSHSYYATGTYTINLIVKDTICHLTDSVFRTVILLPRIQASIFASMEEGCVPLSLLMCDTDPSTTQYTRFHWTFDNGDKSQKNCDSVFYDQPGMYYARLVVTDTTTCNVKDTSLITIRAKVTPKALFNLPDSQNVLYPVTIDNASKNGLNFLWNFDDGQQTNLENPTHQFIQQGIYNICLSVINNACLDTVCHELRVFENSQAIWFPDAFSPNGDGQNDLFSPLGIGIVSSEMIVYDRWGEKVFESMNAIKDGWNGTYKGSLVRSGVYVVHFKATFLNNKTVDKMVMLTIIR